MAKEGWSSFVVMQDRAIELDNTLADATRVVVEACCCLQNGGVTTEQVVHTLLQQHDELAAVVGPCAWLATARLCLHKWVTRRQTAPAPSLQPVLDSLQGYCDALNAARKAQRQGTESRLDLVSQLAPPTNPGTYSLSWNTRQPWPEVWFDCRTGLEPTAVEPEHVFPRTQPVLRTGVFRLPRSSEIYNPAVL